MLSIGYFKICYVLNNPNCGRVATAYHWQTLRNGNAWTSTLSKFDNAVKQWRRRLCSCVAVKGGHFEQSL